MIMFYVLITLVVIEIIVTLVIKYFRREFQWFITEEDECPELSKEGLKKFFSYSFDPFLGWVRRPNTSGVEKGKLSNSTFEIDARGARNLPFDVEENVIASFGDSYTFCRQVKDNETWQYHLSKKLQAGVLNFGVGNYGIDQALLRYESMELPETVKMVILGFVPETICRIHSYWKHYLEYGNTFAFKPRFMIDKGKLVLHKCAMQGEDDFNRIREKTKDIQALDYFYNTKFKSEQFRFPYLISFFRHPLRNCALLWLLIKRKLFRVFGISSPCVENAPFQSI
ncbi:MAG: hypothetical protein KAR20_26495, partial [Candidatus Heimdallarchaeota archaeon]|nr:hypothetical protein [Candidatus Heimdallarchaeota archaeon]